MTDVHDPELMGVGPDDAPMLATLIPDVTLDCMEAVVVAAREVVSPNTQSRMSALFALHDAIAALDALP